MKIRDFETTYEEMLAASRYDPRDVLTCPWLIPAEKGVYVWWWRRSTFPSAGYVGSSVASKGALRLRIVQRHLNPGYLEDRRDRCTVEDEFQWTCPAYKYPGSEPCIDRSSFRRNIGRRHKIAPGQPTVDFIIHNFTVSFLVLPKWRRELIKCFEAYLIDRFDPPYNLLCRGSLRCK